MFDENGVEIPPQTAGLLLAAILSDTLMFRSPTCTSLDEKVARELAEIADRTGGVAFVMYPTSMEDLMKIADENKLMPPKSTRFEPKLRSGLFIHKL